MINSTLWPVLQDAQIAWNLDWPALAGIAYLLVATPALTVIDLCERRLPNKIVLPGLAVAIAGQVIAGLLDANSLARFWAAILVALGVFALGLIANLRNGFGMGDVKLSTLAALSVAWLHPELVLWLLGLACLSGTLQIAGRAIHARKLELAGTIAFGPHLLFGALASAVWFLLRAG